MKRTIALAAAAISLAACCSEPKDKDEAMLAVADPATLAAAAPACGCHDSAKAAAPAGAPLLYASMPAASNLGVAYGQPGAREYAKMGFAIPAGAMECLANAGAEGLQLVGRTIRCLTNSFFPPVEPSQRFVALKPVKAAEAPKAEEPKVACPPKPPPPPEPIASTTDTCGPNGCGVPGR